MLGEKLSRCVLVGERPSKFRGSTPNQTADDRPYDADALLRWLHTLFKVRRGGEVYIKEDFYEKQKR